MLNDLYAGSLLPIVQCCFCTCSKQVLVELVEGPIRRSILNMDNPE